MVHVPQVNDIPAEVNIESFLSCEILECTCMCVLVYYSSVH